VRTPIVIDTDPGIDDLVTLALAARSPSLEIVAVTTTYGNARLEQTTRNAREALRLAGRPDVRVLPGSPCPLGRPLVTAPETHGETGVGHAAVPPPQPTDGSANPQVLIDVLRLVDRPIVLVTLGPLTNLAHALDADPRLVRDRVSHHIGMFGNLRERGNTNRWADFNAWCDPEAVQRVLAAQLDTLMVGLDVTRRMVLTATEVNRLTNSADPLVSWLGQALRFYVEFHVLEERLNGCVVNDVLTIGELLAPGLLTPQHVPLRVDLDGGDHRGHTREDPRGQRTAVAVQVDVAEMRRLLEPVFGGRWSDQVEGGDR
jgi:inosine-uridine nucleoside N-ribohydrolase